MNHSGIPQIHSNGEENSLSGEERLIKIFLSPPLCQKPMIRKGNPDSTTGVLFASLVKSANEPSMEEFFCTNFFPPKMCMGRVMGPSIHWEGGLGLNWIAKSVKIKRSPGVSPFSQLTNACSCKILIREIGEKKTWGNVVIFNLISKVGLPLKSNLSNEESIMH